ncbi:TPA: hypothetical protein R4X16_000595 [Klebsiella variicola subsp. variicola]|uniref:hypothetical protein n=1 Tax=Klebsiella TaxID=570 RepID=UPI00166175A6|nr:hypothetical protein [Klebsiella variicola]MBD0720908.1 hypothetical protein [Klebsiella variicola]HED1709675.1 hypothetical protein [Klebsiella variicola subsp. variicola]
MTNSTKPSMQDLVVSVTAEEVVNYLKSNLNPLDKEKTTFTCHFCKSNEWSLKTFPEDPNRPLVVTHPIPQKDVSAWYFPVFCEKCGYTVFFDAATLTLAIEKKRNEGNLDV